ncbi:MAG: RNA 3'-terminal phosphate cyclase [Candidatus Kariarchaeaceae archaeon]|jgi:RNA 3'-terminal phosphate cyclase (ATP)
MNLATTDFTIDGAIGGGSVLRVAVPIALALNKSIRVENIRSGRSKPGLRLQHLAGLELLCILTKSTLSGGKIGSTEIIINPNTSPNIDDMQSASSVTLDTAASVSLIIQALVNYSSASRHSLSVEFNGGGTHTQWSPNLDYLEYVTKPLLQHFGLNVSTNFSRQGFYPRGGAQGLITIDALPEPHVTLLKAPLSSVDVVSIASTSLKKAQVAERQITGFKTSGIAVNDTLIHYSETANPGSSFTAIMKYGKRSIKGTSALGKRGIPAEKIGKTVALLTKNEIKSSASVDYFMADQLLVPLVFSKEKSSYTIPEITDHVKTNLSIIKHLLGPVISIEDEENFIRVFRNENKLEI